MNYMSGNYNISCIYRNPQKKANIQKAKIRKFFSALRFSFTDHSSQAYPKGSIQKHQINQSIITLK